LHDLKCGHKMVVGHAQFLNMFIASVHLSAVQRYVYCIWECIAVKLNQEQIEVTQVPKLCIHQQ
jgi:hypothetical protein